MKHSKLILFFLLIFVSISANANPIKYDHVAFGYITRGVFFTHVGDFIAVTYKTVTSSGQEEEYLRILNLDGSIHKDHIRVPNHVNKIRVFGQRVFVLGNGEFSVTDLLRGSTNVHCVKLSGNNINIMDILPELPTESSDLYVLLGNMHHATATLSITTEISIGKETDNYTMRNQAIIPSNGEFVSASALRYINEGGLPVIQYFITTKSNPTAAMGATYKLYYATFSSQTLHISLWHDLENPVEKTTPIKFLEQTDLKSGFVMLAATETRDSDSPTQIFTYLQNDSYHDSNIMGNSMFMLYSTQNSAFFFIKSGTNTLEAKFQGSGSGRVVNTHNFPSNSVVDDVAPVFLQDSLDVSPGTTPTASPPSGSPNSSFFVAAAHAVSVLSHVNNVYHVDIFGVSDAGTDPFHARTVRLPTD